MKILMVCLGNICRSPLADGLLRKKVAKLGLDIKVDSAGTSSYHVGAKPDERMTETAKSFGCDIEYLRARQFVVTDFDLFDQIYVMDSSNYSNVMKLARNEGDRAKVELILNEVHPRENRQVPDPYFGGSQGFVDVYNMLDEATDKIIEKYNK